MSTIKNYIYVKNHIPAEVCKELIDECNKKKWQKTLGVVNIIAMRNFQTKFLENYASDRPTPNTKNIRLNT